jgi:hypothetical protein
MMKNKTKMCLGLMRQMKNVFVSASNAKHARRGTEENGRPGTIRDQETRKIEGTFKKKKEHIIIENTKNGERSRDK